MQDAVWDFVQYTSRFLSTPRGERDIHAYKSMYVELVGRHKFKDMEFTWVKCGQAALCRTEWNTLLSSFLSSRVPYDSQAGRPTCVLQTHSGDNTQPRTAPFTSSKGSFPDPPSPNTEMRYECGKLCSQSSLLRNVSTRNCVLENNGREGCLQENGRRENSAQNGDKKGNG